MTSTTIRRLPNLLTISRLIAASGMVVAAFVGAKQMCVALAIWAFVSDVVDGPLARRLGVASARGARLDSMADCALYLTAPWVALATLPWIRANETPAALEVFASYALPVVYGMLKFRRLTSYHTTAARIAGVSLLAGIVVLGMTRVSWPLHLAVLILAGSAIEEMLITHHLTSWRADIRSFAQLRSGAAIAPPSPVAVP